MPGLGAEPVGLPRGCRRHRALRLPAWLRQCCLCPWAQRHRGSPVLVALPPRVLSDAFGFQALPDLERWIHAPRMTRSRNAPSPSRASLKRSANCRSAGLRSWNLMWRTGMALQDRPAAPANTRTKTRAQSSIGSPSSRSNRGEIVMRRTRRASPSQPGIRQTSTWQAALLLPSPDAAKTPALANRGPRASMSRTGKDAGENSPKFSLKFVHSCSHCRQSRTQLPWPRDTGVNSISPAAARRLSAGDIVRAPNPCPAELALRVPVDIDEGRPETPGSGLSGRCVIPRELPPRDGLAGLPRPDAPVLADARADRRGAPAFQARIREGATDASWRGCLAGDRIHARSGH